MFPDPEAETPAVPGDDYSNTLDELFGQAPAATPEAPESEQATPPAQKEDADGKEPAEKPAEPDAPAEPAAPVEPAPAEKPAADAPAPAAPAQPTPPPAPAPAPAPAPQPAAQLPANLDTKFLAQAIAEAQAEQARQQATNKKPEAPKQLTDADFLNEDQSKALAKFKDEWPDEHRAVDHLVNARVQAIMGNRINALADELNKVLQPLFESQQQNQQLTTQNYILTKHPDLPAIVEDLGKWISEQPALVQAPLKQIYDKGDPQQVVELLDFYKQSKAQTGAAPVPPASSAAQEAPKPAAAAPAPAKPKAAPAAAVVAGLAAVPPGQRQTPRAAPDVNDYQGALDEAFAAVGSGRS